MNISTNPDLLRLVGSMTHVEKSCFKKFAKNNSSDNVPKHLLLFELLEKNGKETPTDPAICQKLKIKSKPQYSMIKKHLMNELMDCLAFLHRDNHVGYRGDFATVKIQLLLEKQLHEIAAKMILHEKEESVRAQLFRRHLKLLDLEYELLRFVPGKNNFDILNNQMQLIRDAAKAAAQSEELQIIFKNILNLKNNTNARVTLEEVQEVDAICRALKGTKLITPIHPLLEILYNACMAIATYLSGDSKLCEAHCTKLSALWKKHPHLGNSYPRLFFESALITFYRGFRWKNSAAVAQQLASFDRAATTLVKEKDQQVWQLIYFSTQLKIHHKNADYDTVKRLLREKGATMLRYADQNVVPQREALTLYTTIAISYFVLDEFREADAMMYKIKEINRVAQRTDVYYFALIFHLVVMFEMKDWYRFYHAVNGAYQSLHKSKAIRPFEKELMLFLKKLPNLYTSQKLYEKAIAGFIVDLEKYSNDPVKKMYFLYFNYLGWMQSKVEKIPYTKFVAQQLGK